MQYSLKHEGSGMLGGTTHKMLAWKGMKKERNSGRKPALELLKDDPFHTLSHTWNTSAELFMSDGKE